MHTLVLALFLAAILSFLFPAVRLRLQNAPAVLFAIPLLLTLVFCALAAAESALSLPLALLVFIYTSIPAGLAFVQRAHPPQPSWLDLAIILFLWLPLEFSAGAHLIPKHSQGFLHSVAYGVSILLALTLFIGVRRTPGLKYDLPRLRDIGYGIAAFLISAPILIVIGRLLGFIPPFHPPAGKPALAFVAIFFGTALPEEILFRSLIQNWLMQRCAQRGAHFRAAIEDSGPQNSGGAGRPVLRDWGVLAVAALIFGCAHLDNGPQPLPNWRYMILATIAGLAYGKAFQKSSSVFSSVTCHALVDATKHIFF